MSRLIIVFRKASLRAAGLLILVLCLLTFNTNPMCKKKDKAIQVQVWGTCNILAAKEEALMER